MPDVGQEVRMLGVRLDELLPATSDYVTYDGSLTQPGCQETVTWLLLNKPLYVTQRHVRDASSFVFDSQRISNIYSNTVHFLHPPMAEEVTDKNRYIYTRRPKKVTN